MKNSPLNDSNNQNENWKKSLGSEETNTGIIKERDNVKRKGINEGEIVSTMGSITIDGDSKIAKARDDISIGGDNIEKAVSDMGNITIQKNNLGIAKARDNIIIIGNNNNSNSEMGDITIRGDSKIAKARDDISISGDNIEEAVSEMGNITIEKNNLGIAKARDKVVVSGDNLGDISAKELVQTKTNHGTLQSEQKVKISEEALEIERIEPYILISSSGKSNVHVSNISSSGDMSISINGENVSITGGKVATKGEGLLSKMKRFFRLDTTSNYDSDININSNDVKISIKSKIGNFTIDFKDGTCTDDKTGSKVDLFIETNPGIFSGAISNQQIQCSKDNIVAKYIGS